MEYDKKSWGDGEWLSEVDSYEEEYRGIRIRCLRNPTGGNWNGYFEIPNSIKFDEDFLEVHGGITFSNGEWWPIYGGDVKKDHEIWGFDAGHWNDFCPKIEAVLLEINNLHFSRQKKLKELMEDLAKQFPHFKKTYKNLNYMISECKKGVNQILDGKNENKD